MNWLWIVAGLLLLLAGGILTYLLRRSAEGDGSSAVHVLRHVRLHPDTRSIRLIRHISRENIAGADLDALLDSARALLAHLARLNRMIHRLPALPASPDGEPRLMDLAREAADSDDLSLQALLDMLKASPFSDLTAQEVAAFPFCIAAAEMQRLISVLRAMKKDIHDRRAGLRLAAQLERSRNPESMLKKNSLNSIGLSTLLDHLRLQKKEQLLSLLDVWLKSRELSAEALTLSSMQRQLLLAEEIRRALGCFETLERLNWTESCAPADKLHDLLQNEPSGVYTRLTADSQLALRMQIARISRCVHLDAAEVVRQAFILCGEAEDHSLEKYIGYWFQQPEGLRALQHALPTRRGWLYAHLALQPDRTYYAALVIFGVVTGFLFLQSGQPVFILPFFTITIGCVSRYLLGKRPPAMLPGMKRPDDLSTMKTLILVHAEMASPHDAIRAVRQLKAVMHAFPAETADFLLLGDFAPAITAVSSGDLPIVQAASSAIAALDECPRISYLHRGRAWDGTTHRYAARAGMRGAITAVCRLIAQGECEDLIACSTIELASLERKYAYVFTIPADCQPAHGLLERLLSVMAHPFCQRYPTANGHRGYSMLLPEESPDFKGTALIRPDAFLEATDGMLSPHHPHEALCGELAGQYSVPGAHMTTPEKTHSWMTQYTTAIHGFRLSPWQLPWVQTPAGILANPLHYIARFRLRERIRHSLIPLAQCGLILFSLVTQNWLLLLIALLAPEAGAAFHRLDDWLKLLCRLSLIPMRGAVSASALFQLLRRKTAAAPEWVTLEVWVQGLFATLTGTLGFILPGAAVPAFGLTLLFACFPLAHRFLDMPILPAEPLTDAHITLLDKAANAVWHCFRTHVREENQYLPPCSVQYAPSHGEENATSPEAIGAYLLSILCAKDLALLSANEAAVQLQQTLASVAALPMPLGLPCRRYTLPSLTIDDPQVDAAGTAFLLTALLTTTQALRTWLPELSQEYINLSAEAADLASAFDLTRMFDRSAMLFYRCLNRDGQGTGHVTAFADEALLLSIVGCALGQIPPSHLHRLDRTAVRFQEGDGAFSAHETASAHLLCGLFLPIDEQAAITFIRLMSARGHNGVWGQDSCRLFAFDPSLRYRQGVFGIPESAIKGCQHTPVFAPHAAALCLPYAPFMAADALSRFAELGALGPEGFCDAVDMTQGTALVGVHDLYHQGIMLMAIAHILSESPIRRYFCSLPEVEACLPLLQPPEPPLRLPVLRARRQTPEAQASAPYTAHPLIYPPEAHLLGTADFSLLADANGVSGMHHRGLPLTRAAASPGEPGGLQFYLADEGRIYRLGSALLPGDVFFAPGEIRYEQLCGSLRAELVCTVDTIRQRALHIITITNLSTRDRLIELADLLLPDLDSPVSSLETNHDAEKLRLHVRGKDLTLHHTLETIPSPLALHICTDAEAFIGHSGTLHEPAALTEPAADLTAPSLSPCLSFRAKMTLGGRGQAILWFTTSMNDVPAPHLAELNGIRQLAALQHNAISDSAALTADQAACLPLLAALCRCRHHKLAVLLESGDSYAVLHDLAALCRCFHLHGVHMKAGLFCPFELLPALQEAFVLPISEGYLAPCEPSQLPDFDLVLHSNLPLRAQLEAHFTPVAQPDPTRPLIPALLPEKELLHAGNYGGFDPETSDYILQLEPQQTTPSAWNNRHVNRQYAETVDESGFREPFHEQVWLTMENGTRLSPWSKELPRSVRMGAGQTSWEAWSDELDVRLSAAAMPGHRCAIHVLSLRNAAQLPLTLQITVLASLDPNAPLECAPGVVMTNKASRWQAFLAGDGWTALCTNALEQGAVTILPPLHAPEVEQGATAQLTCEVTIAPDASAKVSWLSGYTRHSEDIARALSEIRAQGTSAILRSAHAIHAQRLDLLTFSTPEDTLSLLMNRILPQQAMNAGDLAGLPVLNYLAPQEARRTLLSAARLAQSRDDWAMLSLHAAAYIRITQDLSLLNVNLPPHDDTLWGCCSRALLSLPVDSQGLPLGEARAQQCFLYAMAAHALHDLQQDTALQDFRQRLLNVADTYLWQDGCYDPPLRLDTQVLACRAYGTNARTRQAMHACWATLYDQPHGLIRRHMPSDGRALPGHPENGGMITLDAALCLQSLLKTDFAEEAFELLQALNPLHHTDDAIRLETFRCAPYLLHGGMCASPMGAGRAVPEGGSMAAGVLYASVLEDILGFQREGCILRLHPNIPSDWDEFTLTLREGASTWRISAERQIKTLIIDGDETDADHIILHDDGKIHRVHFPLA